ncbi:MAG: type II toxin-antitoxin system VapC family toxin [Micropruina sp.]|uniref:type II toxin-antitoxin system VapC family toxin n=1 Tax=Micropruina sp. TaxID=2737536 RepID=UPI0039E3DD1E
MIVIDTNVISEAFRPQPAAQVVAWLQALTGDVAITAVTYAELLAGVRHLPQGRRRTTLGVAIDSALQSHRDTQAILPFDHLAAPHYADILAVREKAGLPISTADAQIAAICRAHAAACATRNARDFAHTGIDLIDPWSTRP